MDDIDLLLTRAGGLSAALVFGFITHRLQLSPIVGGVVGPHTPGFEADGELARERAEFGVTVEATFRDGSLTPRDPFDTFSRPRSKESPPCPESKDSPSGVRPGPSSPHS